MLHFGILAALAAAIVPRPPARPRFDVAAIKQSEERDMMYVRTLPGGRLLVNAPVRLMLMNAYGIQFSQLAGAPDWLSSETWTIDARAEGNPTREESMLMLQSLLEERFHLNVHRVSREMSVYALTVARNGPKLAAPKEAGCSSCGRARISMSSDGVLIDGESASLSELARVLAIPLRRPVIDRTALTGGYDIRLQFTEDGAADSPHAGIFTAIQEQLGLKLETAKGLVEVIVIDRVERPTAN